MDKRCVVLTGVGARQVVSGVGLFNDVLMDLVPLTLSVAPETRSQKIKELDFKGTHS